MEMTTLYSTGGMSSWICVSLFGFFLLREKKKKENMFGKGKLRALWMLSLSLSVFFLVMYTSQQLLMKERFGGGCEGKF